ncbi:MAG: LLM class F420-dependent oxidoreductase [Chloroflexi bacterium]|nr:LLM class F420-dependent oxidoreductase [Chloroflexota bacterium]
MAVTFGCSLPTAGALASPENLRSLAQRAEDLGFDSVWVSDHVVVPRHVESFYPYAPDGVPTFRPDLPYFEPLAALNFLAGCTQRVRLGTHVLILPYRNPVVTAKTLATLDVLSGGRVILGAGVGWMEEEFLALGLDTYHQRGAVTDDYIRLFKELWTKDEPEFHGEHYQVSGVGFEPKPVQKPHLPIWIGGHTGPAIRRAAQLGDGWMPIGLRPPAILEPEELAVKIARLRTLTVRAGRPENAVAVCFSTGVTFNDTPGPSRQMVTGRPEQIAADLRQYQDLGVENFIFNFPGADSAAGIQESMERFSREVMPLIPQG